jgi:hypothetical protein
LKIFDKIINKPFKIPLKKGEFAIISNDKINDEERLKQAKALLLKQKMEEQFKDLDGDEALNKEFKAEDEDEDIEDEDEDIEDEDEEIERDEDLSRKKTIDPIEKQRRRLDSLRQIYANLEREEAEENLKIKIIKKKENIANKREKIQQVIDEQKEKDKFYEEPQNAEGYWILKEKWYIEYEDLMVKLANATTDEDRKPINKELKRLENIQKKNKTKNTMNKITRGINKTTRGIGKVTQGIGKFADEIGKVGNELSAVGGKSGGKSSGNFSNNSGGKEFEKFGNFFKDKGNGSRFDDFFKDKKSTGGKFDDYFKDKKSQQPKTKTKTKRKSKNKRKKSKSKKTAVKTATPTEPKNKWENFFK